MLITNVGAGLLKNLETKAETKIKLTLMKSARSQERDRWVKIIEKYAQKTFDHPEVGSLTTKLALSKIITALETDQAIE